MSYGDAVRILAARRHLADLESALRIVGFRLEQGVLYELAELEAQLVVDADQATEEPDDGDESSDAWLIPLDHLWDDSIVDSSSEEGTAWDWGGTPTVAASAQKVGRNGGLVPYVLPSVEIPQVARDTHAAAVLNVRSLPKSTHRCFRSRSPSTPRLGTRAESVICCCAGCLVGVLMFQRLYGCWRPRNPFARYRSCREAEWLCRFRSCTTSGSLPVRSVLTYKPLSTPC